jgi:hypothetical protein
MGRKSCLEKRYCQMRNENWLVLQFVVCEKAVELLFYGEAGK